MFQNSPSPNAAQGHFVEGMPQQSRLICGRSKKMFGLIHIPPNRAPQMSIDQIGPAKQDEPSWLGLVLWHINLIGWLGFMAYQP